MYSKATVNINYGFNKENPCSSDCTKRELGCHKTCEKYINWKQELLQYKKQVKQGIRDKKLFWFND